MTGCKSAVWLTSTTNIIQFFERSTSTSRKRKVEKGRSMSTSRKRQAGRRRPVEKGRLQWSTSTTAFFSVDGRQLFSSRPFICTLEKSKQITNILRILTAQYAMHVSYLSTANFLVTIFVKSERALLDKYKQLGNIHRCQII